MLAAQCRVCTFIQMAQDLRNKSLQNLLNLHVDIMIDGLINAGDT